MGETRRKFDQDFREGAVRKGGPISELTVPLRRRQPKIRTGEDTIGLIRRLAVHYPDAQIAGILNRQGRRVHVRIVRRFDLRRSSGSSE